MRLINFNLKKGKHYIILAFLILVSGAFNPILAQAELELSLSEVVSLAKNDAPDELKNRITQSILARDAQIARTQLSNNYWQYQLFLSNYKPQINLNATLPSFNRSIGPVFQPNGSILFLPFSNMQNQLSASLSQPITKTGGNVFVSTGLRRLDIFGSNGETSYFSSPVAIGFNQPFFAFNQLKWDKVIEPMRYQEAKRQFAENLEATAQDAVRLFFNIYIAGISLEAAKKDKSNADTLYVISKGRYNVGKIAETELLQIEISKLNADGSLAAATLDLQSSTENLRNFLGIKEAVSFKLTPPTEIPKFYIDAQKALAHAKENRSKVIELERRLKEAERNLDQARKNNGFNLSVSGSFGLGQTDATLGGSYTNLLDNESISVSVQMPIMDWGRAEARREIAISNQELVGMSVEQERINFERDILIKVQQFDLVRNQAALALKNYEVSQKTYDLTRKRYLIGKIGVIDLNLALADQDRSRRSYMSALRNFWLAYYEIRRLTLYDFINDKTLVSNLGNQLEEDNN
jgi:outer membrane protein